MPTFAMTSRSQINQSRKSSIVSKKKMNVGQPSELSSFQSRIYPPCTSGPLEWLPPVPPGHPNRSYIVFQAAPLYVTCNRSTRHVSQDSVPPCGSSTGIKLYSLSPSFHHQKAKQMDEKTSSARNTRDLKESDLSTRRKCTAKGHTYFHPNIVLHPLHLRSATECMPVESILFSASPYCTLYLDDIHHITFHPVTCF